MSKQLKNRSFHQPQGPCYKLNQYIPPTKHGIINLCNKKYINHQQNITVDEKLSIKYLPANQDITMNSADTGRKIVIMNGNKYVEESKKITIGQYFLLTNRLI